MTKTAIFVEGQTELIFVREFLLRIFEYQNISISCYTLHKDSELVPAEYEFRNKDAKNYFQILDAGNDNAVLSRILKREKYLFNNGFTKIIGLRDMYSKQYRETVKDASIDPAINQKFIESHNEQISNSDNSDSIHFHFAIMEIEAWLLGIRKLLIKIDGKLTNDFIKEELGIDLNELDPEIAFFHPTKTLESIYDLVGKSYGKSKSDVNAIVNLIDKEDYTSLHQHSFCNSFTAFYNSVLL